MSSALNGPVPRLTGEMALAPQGIAAMQALERSFKTTGLEAGLLLLIKLRASQINGCAFCLDMHVPHFLALDDNPMRLHQLPAWRDSPLYSNRERAALGWCEALTLLAETGAPDADYAALQSQFTPAEQVNLTLAIGAINAWNRLKVGFRALPAGATVSA